MLFSLEIYYCLTKYTMRMKRVCYLLLLLLTLSGCAQTVSIIDNNFQLKQAISPLNPNVVEVEGQCYQDEYVSIQMRGVTDNAIFLTVSNNHNSTIRILWDEAAFVDYNGYSHRINHDGAEINKILLNGLSASRSYVSTIDGGRSRERSYEAIGVVGTIADTEKVQIPDVIPSKSRINTAIVPVGAGQIIRFANANEVKYKDEIGSKENAEKAWNYYQSKIESTAVRLLLPFEVDGKKMEYSFTIIDEFQMSSKNDEEFSGIVLLGIVPIVLLILAA